MAFSAESMMGMTTLQATQAIAEEQSVIDSQVLITPETLRFRKLIQDSRRQGIELTNPTILRITNNTMRAETGFMTRKFEFKNKKASM